MTTTPSELLLPVGHFMTVWVIYYSPSDHPHEYVLRPQFLIKGQEDPVPSTLAWVSTSIETLREALPPGLTRMDRHPRDEQPIVETWV